MDLLHMTMSDALAHPPKENLLQDQPFRGEQHAAESAPNVSIITPQARLVKKRASKACHHCRAKKIKCSLVKTGSPCNTCQLDEVECVVSKSRRNKTPRVARASSSSNPTARKGSSLTQEQAEPTDSPESTGLVHSLRNSFAVFESPSNAPSNVSTQASPELAITHHSQNSASNLFQLPQYFRPPPPRILKGDILLLAERGVFNLPETALRNELLRNYTNYVHPLLPVLDLRQFLKVIGYEETNCPVSLMVFYAVMACGTFYVESHTLEIAGYVDRKTAQEIFFQKAKVIMLLAIHSKQYAHECSSYLISDTRRIASRLYKLFC
jgi:hypothetical protein